SIVPGSLGSMAPGGLDRCVIGVLRAENPDNATVEAGGGPGSPSSPLSSPTSLSPRSSTLLNVSTSLSPRPSTPCVMRRHRGDEQDCSRALGSVKFRAGGDSPRPDDRKILG